jgi:hypothetical protein
VSARYTLVSLALAALLAPGACHTDHSSAGASAAGTARADSAFAEEELADTSDSTAPLPPPPLVLSVSSSTDGSAWLYPIAWWSNARSSPGDIPDASDSSFANRHFQPGARYRLYASGADVGFATVDTAGAGACGSLFVKATLTVRPGVPAASVHLATNAHGAWSTPLRRRSLTRAEQARLYPYAADSLRSHQVPTALWGAPDSLDGAVFSGAPPDTEVLVAAMHTGASDSAGDRVISILLVADLVGDSLRVAYGRLFDGYDAELREDRLLDGLHLRHGTWPELVIVSTYYESADYTALHRQGGRWIAWFRGGGGGC